MPVKQATELHYDGLPQYYHVPFVRESLQTLLEWGSGIAGKDVVRFEDALKEIDEDEDVVEDANQLVLIERQPCRTPPKQIQEDIAWKYQSWSTAEAKERAVLISSSQVSKVVSDGVVRVRGRVPHDWPEKWERKGRVLTGKPIPLSFSPKTPIFPEEDGEEMEWPNLDQEHEWDQLDNSVRMSPSLGHFNKFGRGQIHHQLKAWAVAKTKGQVQSEGVLIGI